MSDVPQDEQQNNDSSRRKSNKPEGDGNHQPGLGGKQHHRKLEEDNERKRWSFRGGLPPAPEDGFVMMGDLLSLSVYSFADHFVCQDLAQFFLAPSSSSASSAASPALVAPVWLDSAHPFSDHVMSVLVRDASVVHYSPILQPTGLAATVLATCWLLSGYLNHAFAYRNTLDCSTPRTLIVTARSWVVSSLLVMAAVILTSNTSPEHWRQAFTIGDIAYIWDSLTVLCVWRFMASSLLGSGGGGEDDTGGW
jgi:hypothetical protein